MASEQYHLPTYLVQVFCLQHLFLAYLRSSSYLKSPLSRPFSPSLFLSEFQRTLLGTVPRHWIYLGPLTSQPPLLRHSCLVLRAETACPEKLFFGREGGRKRWVLLGATRGKLRQQVTSQVTARGGRPAGKGGASGEARSPGLGKPSDL